MSRATLPTSARAWANAKYFRNVRGIDGGKIEFVVGCFRGEFDGDDDDADDNGNNNNNENNNNNHNADMTGSRLRGTLEIKD